MYKVLTTYLFLLAALVSFGRERVVAGAYSSMADKSTEWLMDQGRSYFTKHVPDSALVCFSIVEDRYNRSRNANDKETAALAHNNLACIYQYMYFDYRQAHHHFMKALDLCKDENYERTQAIVSLNLANLLSLYGNGFESESVSKQAKQLYEQSMAAASRVKAWDLYATAFIDYLEKFPNADLNKYQQLFSKEIPDTTQNVQFARCYYRAQQEIQHGNYAQARQWLHQQIESTNDKWMPELYVLLANVLLGDTYMHEHNYSSAIETLLQAKELAKEKKAIDYEITIHQKLAECYSLMGDNNKAQAFKMRYLEIKDSVHEANSLVSIGEMNLVHELQVEESKMQELAEQHERQRNILLIALIGLAIALAFTFALLRAYRLLRNRNKSLYEKHQAVMRAEAEERQLRKDYEEKLKQSNELLEKQVELSQRPKYSKSSLNDEDKQQLIVRIQDIMNDADVICQQDFTLAKLAKMIDSNTSYVSQVINEKYGMTFSNLLGHFRVREACCRMDDVEHYGKMTIEAISESVGFRSRVTFFSAFKREIGMSPSDYWRIAKSK